MSKKNLTRLETLWFEELPGFFNKSRAIEKLIQHWGICKSAVFPKIKKGKFEIPKDVDSMYEELGIDFDRRKGFSFDREQYEKIMQQQDQTTAQTLQLIPNQN